MGERSRPCIGYGSEGFFGSVTSVTKAHRRGKTGGMSLLNPTCPICSEPLDTVDAGMDMLRWTCAAGHGDAVAVAVAHQILQEDEIDELWRDATEAANGDRPCPACSQPMKVSTINVDDDLIRGNVAEDAVQLTLDVCLDDQIIWFDKGELDQMPGPHQSAFEKFKARFHRK